MAEVIKERSDFSPMITEGLGYEVILILCSLVAISVFYFSTFFSGRNNDNRQPEVVRLQPRQSQHPLGPCPICLEEEMSLCVETSCGHHFCGSCFMTLWNDRILTPVTCPMCRQRVTILFPAFTAQELGAVANQQQLHEVVTRLNRFNSYYSGQGVPIATLLRDLPQLLPRLVAELFSPAGFSLLYSARIVLIVIIAVAYTLSPLDILPEAVFGVLGFLDDLVVLLLSLMLILFLYRQFVANRQFALG